MALPLALYCILVDRRRLIRIVVAAFAFYVVLFTMLNNMAVQSPLLLGVQQRFFMQPFALVCFLVGVGIHHIRNRNVLSPFLVDNLIVAFLLAHVGRPFLQQIAIRTAPAVVDIHARSALTSMPEGSIVLATGDLIVHPMLYLQACERVRPDVRVIAVPNMISTWFVEQQSRYFPGVVFPGLYMHGGFPGGFTARDFLDSNVDRAPVFTCGGLPPAPGEDQSALKRDFLAWPIGICSRILRPTEKPANLTAYLGTALSLLDVALFGMGSSQLYDATSWEYDAFRHVWLRRALLFEHAYNIIFPNYLEESLLRIAADLADRIVDGWRAKERFARPDSNFWKQAADVYGHLSVIQRHPYEDRMFVMFESALDADPNDHVIAEVVRGRHNPYRNR